MSILLFWPGAPAVAPTFTATQGDKSASDGTTTTLSWSADGTPAPTIKVQRLGSGGGAPTLISTVILTPGSSATPGAQSLTVPSDAQGVVVFTRGYQSPTLSLTSNFAGTFTIVQDTGNEITSVSYAPVTSTGSKTLTPSWSTGPTEGPLFIVAFVKDIDNSSIGAWVRDSDALANDVVGSSFGLTVDSTTTDLVLAFDTQYNTGLTVPADESGWTSITTQGLNSDAGRLRSADSPGATTTTATTQGTQYRGMAIVSIVGAGPVWTDVTTGTNFTGSSPLTYTTPTLTLADNGSQWRAVATNTAGSVNSASMTLTVTGGGSYTLTAQGGSYALTGGTAVLERDRRLTASGGSYTVTGASAQVNHNRHMTSSGGSYTLTGGAAVLERDRRLTANGGSYTLTGGSAVLERDRRLTANGGSYTIAGAQVDITYSAGAINYSLIALGGAYTVTGASAGLSRNRRMTSNGGAYIITGTGATIERDRRLTASGGTYTVAGGAAVMTATGAPPDAANGLFWPTIRRRRR